MSRSRKKNPFCGSTTARSEKQDKRAYNRCYRRASEIALCADPSGEQMPLLKEHSDPWGMDKDGKMRFDPEKQPRLMRK